MKYMCFFFSVAGGRAVGLRDDRLRYFDMDLVKPAAACLSRVCDFLISVFGRV